MIPDRHHGHDLLAVEEQGQRPLDDDRGLDLPAVLIDPHDAPGKAWIVRVGPHCEFFHTANDGEIARVAQVTHADLNFMEMRRIIVGTRALGGTYALTI